MIPAPVGELDRRTYIGGSDVAAIMGISPWQTPLQCYEKKISTTPEAINEEKRKFFARRKRQEPVIAEMLADEGIEVTRLSLDASPNRYIDGDLPFLAAEIDFEFVMSDSVRDRFSDRPEIAAIPDGATCNGEIKTVHPFAAHEWGEQGSEDVPIHYSAQVMHGLGVTRRPLALVAALFGLDNLSLFAIMPDAETIAGMRAKCSSFWHDHVIARIAPDPINMEDMMRLFARAKGRPVEADEDTIEALINLGAIRSKMSAFKKDKEELEFQIANFVRRQWGIDPGEDSAVADDAIILARGLPYATWKSQSHASIDSKRLRAEHPEIAHKFTNISYFRSFRFPKQKGA